MFTGIVQTIGTVSDLAPAGGDVRLTIAAAKGYLEGTALGDSISVNGCCLTVTEFVDAAFVADVSRETLSLTTLGSWGVGTRVNLEKALRAGDALGGHYVSGHVDGVATVMDITSDARSQRVKIAAPAALARYIARKGSVTIDGVSLTVNGVGDLRAGQAEARFDVNLVPHTLDVTILGGYKAGTRVNFEVDVIARYVDRMLEASVPGR